MKWLERYVRNDLTPDQITIASQTMLPTYPQLAFIVGIGYVFISPERLHQSATLSAVDVLMPLPVWGSVFLAIAAILWFALYYLRNRQAYLVGLALMGSTMLLWTGVLAYTTFFADGTLTGWVWPLFAARCCQASAKTLLAREVRW